VELLPIQLGQEVPCIRRFERELQLIYKMAGIWYLYTNSVCIGT
jgi:hypothetical protein